MNEIDTLLEAVKQEAEKALGTTTDENDPLVGEAALALYDRLQAFATSPKMIALDKIRDTLAEFAADEPPRGLRAVHRYAEEALRGE